jgi:hypothetical protein
VETTQRYRTTVPRDQDSRRIVADFLEAWLARPELRSLVEKGGGIWPDAGDLVVRLRILHEFSERWDFRRGAERLQIAGASADIDPEIVMAEAMMIGMASYLPPSDPHYDHAIVLGGTALANLNRLRSLHELIDDGLDVGNVCALTALREMPSSEVQLVRERPEFAHLVENTSTEFDVFVAAATEMFSAQPQIERTDDDNPNLSHARAEIGPVTVLAAPSADPERRPNTRDNYAVHTSEIENGDSVLIVTSSIYLPYQFFVGLQALGLDRSGVVEAIGFPPAWMGGVLTGPTNVLQELRSAFFGALALAEAVCA